MNATPASLDRALHHPLLSADRERALAVAARGGDLAARDQLVLHNLRLVLALLPRSAPAHVVEDRIQDGVIGLLEAIDRYNPTLGFRFSTYATWWIRRELITAARRDHLVRPPRGSITSSEARLAAERATQPPEYLDAPLSDENDNRTTLGDRLPSAEEDPHDTAATRERRTAMAKAIHELSETARSALWLRYGFADGVERNWAAVGASLGLPRETVLLAHRRAVAQLRDNPDLKAQVAADIRAT